MAVFSCLLLCLPYWYYLHAFLSASISDLYIFLSFKLLGTERVLHAVARCDASVEELHGEVKELHGKVNEILQVLHAMKKEQKKPMQMKDFASVQTYIPVEALQDFKDLCDQLESDASFEKLMVCLRMIIICAVYQS